MKPQKIVNDLEARLTKLRNKIESLREDEAALLRTIKVYAAEDRSKSTRKHSQHVQSKDTGSRSNQFISAAVELIGKRGKPVKVGDILTYIKEKGIDVAGIKNLNNALRAVLSLEIHKQNTRLQKAGRGLYQAKQ